MRQLYDALNTIRLAGTDIIDNLFFMGDGFFGEMLFGLLAIVLNIVWGILVYCSPIIIPVVIYMIIRGRIVSRGIKKLAKGLAEEVLAACEQEGIHNVSAFSAFFQGNNCAFILTSTGLTLQMQGKNICAALYSKLGYKLTTNSSGPQNSLKRKLKKLGKTVAKKLSISCKVEISSKVDSGLEGIGPAHIESKLSSDGKTIESKKVYDQYYGWYRESNVTCRLTPRHNTSKKTPAQDDGLKKL